jgi:hypothetical protein
MLSKKEALMSRNTLYRPPLFILVEKILNFFRKYYRWYY